MELILQTGLSHQQKAVDAIADTFKNVEWSTPGYYYQNPQINLQSEVLRQNVAAIQQRNLRQDESHKVTVEDSAVHLDIKMETGTGKTYVYTQTIFELHKRYGVNKFIIVVPSLPIKEGAKQFLSDEYAKRHFADTCGYGSTIELGVLEAMKSKKGKKFFPGVVRTFVEGANLATNRIYVLLANMQLLTNAKVLKDNDYDSETAGFYRPFDALKATRPFVIIDEPHRFAKEQQAFQAIINELAPQCLIRYGATFPEVTRGRGKNKISSKDYCNLLYNLDACDSFNLGLIKGIAKEHFEPLSQKQEKVKIVSIEKNESVRFQFVHKDAPVQTYELKKGDSLAAISSDFENLRIAGIGKDVIELSNGQCKAKGEVFNTDIYSSSYQEQMLKLAIERHFETERENFSRQFKIKTLALFFIDDISSYRELPDSDKKPYLKDAFERLLKERIDIELARPETSKNTEYRDYLLASKANIALCHAGYFSQDQSDSDEAIAKEVHEILVDKKSLLSIRDENGNYNVRRFLFSKWTLKEGWDNPNVFTIAKLRSSGSEISKLQEVGRGLRLPVDEYGNRISDGDFQLNYIVDFTEADFATRLVEQINGERPAVSVISDVQLQTVANKLGIEADELFITLLSKHYVGRNYEIKTEHRDTFFAEYPDFASGLNTGKVKDRNKTKNLTVRVRKNNFDELKELWEKINEKYILYYDRIKQNILQCELCDLLKSENVFQDIVISSIREKIDATNQGAQVQVASGVQYSIRKKLPYSVFLHRLNSQTNLPIVFLHTLFVQYSKLHEIISSEYFNESSLAKIIQIFEDWKSRNLGTRFHYKKAGVSRYDTALTNADGSLKNIIAQGLVGTKLVAGKSPKKYLYDQIAYDSPLEKENILTSIEEVVVYGKIPRRSIAIPTITGFSYSPDFMYVVKRKSGDKELNIVVETKDVGGKSDLRGIEAARITCAKAFFEQLTLDGYKVFFHTQLNDKKIRQIIDDVFNH